MVGSWPLEWTVAQGGVPKGQAFLTTPRGARRWMGCHGVQAGELERLLGTGLGEGVDSLQALFCSGPDAPCRTWPWNGVAWAFTWPSLALNAFGVS